MSRSFERQPAVPRDEPPDPHTGAGEWVLACRRCGRQLVPDTAEINRYLATGWPQCCEAEMVPSIRLAGD
jgi:hypothetical protein